MNNSATIKTKNPYFKAVLNKGPSAGDRVVTKGGVCAKILYFFLVNFAGVAVYMAGVIPQSLQIPIAIGGLIVMLILSIVTAASPKSVPFFGTIYSVIQGYLIAWAAAMYASEYYGIVPLAAVITAAVVLVMLVLYASGIVKVGHRFRGVVSGMFLVIIVVAGITFVSSFFTPMLANALYGDGPIGLIFSVICTLVFVLHLAIDFDNISYAIENRSDKIYEWALAMGLVTTILMLFLRILELLSRTND